MFQQPLFKYINFLNMGLWSPLHNERDFTLYLNNIKSSWEPLSLYELNQVKKKLQLIQSKLYGEEYKKKIDRLWSFIWNKNQLKKKFLELHIY